MSKQLSFHSLLLVFLFLLSTLLASAVNAEVEVITSEEAIEKDKPKTDWGRCSAYKQQNQQKNAYSKVTQQPVLNAVYLEADKGTINPDAVSTLQGNVIIQKNGTLFNANAARYDRSTQTVTATGNVILAAPNIEIKSNKIKYNLKDKTGTVEKTKYKVGKLGARGKSQSIELINPDLLQLQNATFSSCPSPVPSWHIKSSKITLNNKTQQGSAKNVTFNIKGRPVFYFPRFNFALNNNRKSGFLTPHARIQSNASLSLPYYFNLAPNYDATVTTSFNEHQGLKFDNEFRYLTQKHKGQLKYEFVPADKSFDNKFRDYFNLKHQTTLSQKTKLNFNAEGVSDKAYFNNISNSLEASSRSSLQRRLEITHKNQQWTLSAAIEDYQVLDIAGSPYSRLPELKLGYQPKVAPHDIKVGLDLELVNFYKSSAVRGMRLDAKATVSKKWGNDAWFIKPSLSVQSTLYALQNNNIGDSAISRTLPTFTLESGLFFDRDVSLHTRRGTKNFTQTLEPHIYYSYTPFKDQSHIPVFDTARTHYSASTQLFSDNRFTGKDRIADTNRLSFVVSSRLQDRKSGKEILKASIGQVFNFSDRRVTLPNGNIETGTRSDLVLELSGRINDRLRVSTSALWNIEKKEIRNTELRLNYQDEKRRIANISYRKLNTELNSADAASTQLTISGAYPINDKWSVVGSVERDIENKRNLETLVGLEYQDCCWKTRVVAKRFLNADNETYETPIFIEFELKGLGRIDNGARRELKDKIYGYDDY